MSTLKVQKIDVKKEMDWGNVYLIIGDVDGELQTVELSTKPQYAPKVGDTIQGTIEESQWGKKFKKESSGGFNGGRGGGRTPEEKESIEWQSARRDAIEFMKLRASLLKPEEALSFVTTDNVLITTKKFATQKEVTR